jgi:hypothetical protein
MPTIPQSIHNPSAATAAERAIRANIDISAGADSDPVAGTDLGFNTHGAQWLHILAKAGDAGTTFDFEVWLWDVAAGDWYLDTRLGTAGTVTVIQTADDHPKGLIVEIAGAPRVFVKLDNNTGTWSGDADKGASIWISHNSDGVY